MLDPGCYIRRSAHLLLLAYLLLVPQQLSECSSAMKRLYEDLFTDYNRLILPVANNKTKVTVTLGLKLGQILDLNLKQQILSTNVWVEQTWHDFKLQWEPALYEGIDMIHVPAENIWIPDIVLFNNADGNYELTLVAKARLYSNGTVVWKPPTMFRSTCEIDVEYFPFDIQTCFLRFGSWTYAGDEVELRPVGSGRKVDIGIDLSQFYKNVEWDIIDVPAYYNEVYYDCCNEPFPDITFKIVIRRKMLFYLVNLILPVALMTFMTVSVFYLPSDSNEKVTLSISILTSLIVFFLLMLEIIPASSLAVPLFGKYLLFTLVLVSLSACLSVYVLNIHHRSPSIHQMSPRARKIFLDTLPRLLRLNRPDPNERSSLNRFRKKKIAQQMLNQSAAAAANKVYDLSQPLAGCVNLIETLQKGYEFSARDDDPLAPAPQDDEGRYFRKYVDNYISRLKLAQGSKPSANIRTQSQVADVCKCCTKGATRASAARQPQQRAFAARCCSGANLDWTESSADMLCPLVGHQTAAASFDESSPAAANCNRCRLHSRPPPPPQTSTSFAFANSAGLGQMLQDDTLDMTFDYDYGADQAADGRSKSCAIQQQQQRADEEQLPSPPPPPRQVTQLSGGRVSSCSRNNMTTSLDSSMEANSDQRLADNACLVDKLINSIHLINNASDEMDTTTLSTPETDDGPTSRPELVTGPSFDHMSPLVLGTSGDTGEDQQPQLRKRLDHSNGFGLPNQQQQQQFGAYRTGSGLTTSNRHITSCTCLGQANSQYQHENVTRNSNKQPDLLAGTGNVPLASEIKQPSDLLLSLRLSYDQMPAHVRAAIRSILFIADTIKNEDDENSAIEDWESMSMVVDRLFLWIFFLLCTFGSVIILALAPSLFDQRASIDDKLRLDIPLSNCSASVV